MLKMFEYAVIIILILAISIAAKKEQNRKGRKENDKLTHATGVRFSSCKFVVFSIFFSCSFMNHRFMADSVAKILVV